MKSATLFQLGGIALLIAAILYAVNNAMYFLNGQPDDPTTFGLWLIFVADSFLLFGITALFARQSQRGGLLGLVGYVLLVVSSLLFFGNYAVSMGVSGGAFTFEQIADVPSYNFALAVMPWTWIAGLIVFGISIYRAQVFPKYAGALLVLLAVLNQLTGVLAFTIPIFALCGVVAWAWLGWSLLRGASAVVPEAAPAA